MPCCAVTRKQLQASVVILSNVRQITQNDSKQIAKTDTELSKLTEQCELQTERQQGITFVQLPAAESHLFRGRVDAAVPMTSAS